MVAAGGGDDYSCALTAEGQVWCWGNEAWITGNSSWVTAHVPRQVPGLDAVVELSMGGVHVCALQSDGSARCWGRNTYGQLGNGTTEHRSTPFQVFGPGQVTGIAAGDNFSCAVMSNATVQCWGYNSSSGSLGDGSTAQRWVPGPVTALADVVQIATGYLGACARHANGTVSCWGAGPVGDGTSGNRLTPVLVPGITDAIDVGMGLHQRCVVHQGGAVSCWGNNRWGAIGDGTSNTTRNSPVAVVGLVDAVRVAGGGNSNESYTCALRATGGVMCWGRNDVRQLGIGTFGDRSTPVAVVGVTGALDLDLGGTHACAATGEAVYCWGNAGPHLGDPARLTATDLVYPPPGTVVWP